MPCPIINFLDVSTASRPVPALTSLCYPPITPLATSLKSSSAFRSKYFLTLTVSLMYAKRSSLACRQNPASRLLRGQHSVINRLPREKDSLSRGLCNDPGLLLYACGAAAVFLSLFGCIVALNYCAVPHQNTAGHRMENATSENLIRFQ